VAGGRIVWGGRNGAFDNITSVGLCKTLSVLFQSLASETGSGVGDVSGSGEQELPLRIVNDGSGVAFSGDEGSFIEGKTRVGLE
jgi:hypothetical protein